MASPQIEKSRLRDLILAFYTRHDPIRLQDGIDISGMVDWTMDKGIGALNVMLQRSYGEVIDVNDRTEINNVEQINRISMAVSGRQVMDMQEMRKVKIAERLKGFYKKYDPSKLPSIFKLTEFALYKGENALNSKLRMKYGVDLRSFDQEEEDDDDSSVTTVDLIPPPEVSMSKPIGDSIPDIGILSFEEVPESPVVVIKKTPSIEDFDVLLPASAKFVEQEIPPPSPNVSKPIEEVKEEPVVETEGGIVENLEDDKEYLQAELMKFYKVHDPDKLVVLDALVLWALQLGRKDYNTKLKQLYGADLDTPVQTSTMSITAAQNKHVTPARFTRINKPIKSKQPSPLIDQVLRIEKRSFVSFEEAAKKSVKRADPLKGPKLFKQNMVPDGEACNNYRIDMSSPLFGICVCGFPKRLHDH